MYNSYCLMHILLLIILFIHLSTTLTWLLLWHLSLSWLYSTFCLDRYSSLSSSLNLSLPWTIAKNQLPYTQLWRWMSSINLLMLLTIYLQKIVFIAIALATTIKFHLRYNMTVAHKNHFVLSISRFNCFKNPNHSVLPSLLPYPQVSFLDSA